MLKTTEKEQALLLRRKGYSYNEIVEKIDVSKSTLSLWLRKVGLSKKQKQRLTEKKLLAMKRGWQKAHFLRIEKLRQIRSLACSEINKLSKTEKFLIGAALYWAEGNKEKEEGRSTDLKFSNTDVNMLRLFQKWLREVFDLRSESLVYELYIHKTTDFVAESKFWSEQLNIAQNKIRVYFKPHNPNPHRKNINKNYHGLIRIVAPKSVTFVRKISGWVDGIYKNW